MFRNKRNIRRRIWTDAQIHHYQQHKASARLFAVTRLTHFNQHYRFTYNRVTIRNTCSRWGSCSSLGNLNFNYQILFLPPKLQDYIIVHELCHLKELNHSPRFWALVAEQVPDFKARRTALRRFSVFNTLAPASSNPIE